MKIHWYWFKQMICMLTYVANVRVNGGRWDGTGDWLRHWSQSIISCWWMRFQYLVHKFAYEMTKQHELCPHSFPYKDILYYFSEIISHTHTFYILYIPFKDSFEIATFKFTSTFIPLRWFSVTFHIFYSRLTFSLLFRSLSLSFFFFFPSHEDNDVFELNIFNRKNKWKRKKARPLTI